MSSSIILSKENASKSLVSWKVQVRNLLESTPLAKNFLGTSTGTDPQTAVNHPVDSLYDFIAKEIPQPEENAYGDPKEYRIDLQKYKQCAASVKVLMKTVLNNSLYELFTAEENSFDGMKSVLLEVQYDEASQLQILKRNLEMISQAESQSVKEYADAVNHIVLQLHALGYPSSRHSEFQQSLTERFLLGMLSKDANRLRLVFDQKNASTFKDMRAIINEEAVREQLSRAQRQSASSSTEYPSALLTTQDLERKILMIVKSALGDSVGIQNRDEDLKVFVGSLSPVTTENQLEAAFKVFGQVVHVKVLRTPDGDSKRCAIIQFKDRFAAEAARRQSRKITVAGRRVTTDVVKRKGGIKTESDYPIAHLAAVVDSGCAPSHLTGNVVLLKDVSKSEPFNIGIADGNTMVSSGIKGNISSKDLEIKDVEVVSGLSNTLLSAYALLKDKKDVWFKSEDMSVNVGHLDPSGRHEVLAKGYAKNGLFEIDLKPSSSTYLATSQQKTWELWHKRFMHHGLPTLKHTLESGVVKGFELVGNFPPTLNCTDCIQGKMHRLPHPPSKYSRENLNSTNSLA